MEYTYIKELLDRYWLAETSLEEERVLKEYFRGGDVDPALEMYRPMFGFLDDMPAPPAHLQERVLRLIEPSRPVRSLYRQGWWYAAAAVLVVSLAINLVPRKPGDPQALEASRATRVTAVVTDTYEDPAQALAAVQHALRMVSTRMNKGREITEARMDRLSANYRLAFKN